MPVGVFLLQETFLQSTRVCCFHSAFHTKLILINVHLFCPSLGTYPSLPQKPTNIFPIDSSINSTDVLLKESSINSTKFSLIDSSNNSTNVYL